MSTDQAGHLTGGRSERVERWRPAWSATSWAQGTSGRGDNVINDDDIVVSIIEDHPMFRRVLSDIVSAAPGMRLGDVGAGLGDVRGAYGAGGGVVLLDFYTP